MDGVSANALSSDNTEKISALKRLKITCFQINLGLRVFQRLGLGQLFIFFVDYETSSDFPSACGGQTMTELSFLGELNL